MTALPRATLILGLAGLLLLGALDASMTEDGYITFRVIDNAVHGFGLTWNTDERVQVYTNPLWMLLHIPFYFLWRDIFYLSIALSLACTLAAAFIALRSAPRPPLRMAALFIVPLLTSRSMTDYATSGLENPLTHLLFACFAFALMRPGHPRYWLHISLAASLSMVNRLDTALFYLPVLGMLGYAHRDEIRWRQCAPGILPLAAWEAFSLFYYGFLFPNTRYAKLDPSIPLAEYLEHGKQYLGNLVVLDFGAACFLLTGIALVPAWLLTRRERPALRLEMLGVSAGIALYSAYVVGVGGSQVSGRFWTLPIFASVWLVYAAAPLADKACLILMTALVALKIHYPAPHRVHEFCLSCFKGNIQLRGNEILLIDQWTGNGEAPPEVKRAPRKRVFAFCKIAGVPPFRAGPYVHMIDTLGLAEPLLARLPCRCSEGGSFGRIGHLVREVPKGYLLALNRNNTHQMDPDLALYYRKLRFIISGELWSWRRLEEIARFNLGMYDPYLERYVERMKKQKEPAPQETEETET